MKKMKREAEKKRGTMGDRHWVEEEEDVEDVVGPPQPLVCPVQKAHTPGVNPLGPRAEKARRLRRLLLWRGGHGGWCVRYYDWQFASGV
jgi:hypothetical protein